MCHFEKESVFNKNALPSVWFRYFDDTFTLFDRKNTTTQFLHYLNNCHANIKFKVKFEENNTIPFLDILIKRHSHTFSTSIFTGLYTKSDSFTPGKKNEPHPHAHFSLFLHLFITFPVVLWFE